MVPELESTDTGDGSGQDDEKNGERAKLAKLYSNYILNYWNKLKVTDNSILTNTRRTFDFSFYLGCVVAFLGIVILIISLYDMIQTDGVGWENTVAGGIGMLSLVSIFFIGPQKRVTRSLGDYVQTHIIKNTYTLISQAWNNWDNAAYESIPDINKPEIESVPTRIPTGARAKIPYTLPELEKLIQILVDNSIKLTSNIETIIGEIETA